MADCANFVFDEHHIPKSLAGEKERGTAIPKRRLASEV